MVFLNSEDNLFSNKDYLSCLSQAIETTGNWWPVSGTGCEVAREARPWAKERISEPGKRQNRPGSANTALATTLSPLDLGQGSWPGGIPQGLPSTEVGSYGGWHQALLSHSVVGRAWASLEKWQAPYFKPKGTKDRPTRLGQGGGAPGSYSQPSAGPGGKFTAPKPPPPGGQREAAGLPLSIPKGMQTGEWGPMSLGLLYLQLIHNQLSGWQGSQPPST